MDPSLIKKQNLYEGVIKYIQGQIISGELKPGDKLPPQDKFAKQLGVSRVTLREALKGLNTLGLIHIKQGGGTYIKEVTPDLFMQPMVPVMMSNENVMEIIEARLYVELGTVHLCSMNRDQRILGKIQKTLIDMEKSLEDEDPNLFTSSDLHFHLAIGEGSGNSILMKILEIIQDILYQQQKKINIYPQVRKESYKDHQRIYQFIKGQDGEKGQQAMLKHLNKVKEFALHVIKGG